MPTSLRLYLLVVDLGFLAYWLITGLGLLPAARASACVLSLWQSTYWGTWLLFPLPVSPFTMVTVRLAMAQQMASL
jgi:hypothetical protein